MKISKEEVEKLAGLVRLEIKDEEKEKFSGDLTSILSYVDKLNKVDTKDIEVGLDGLHNVYDEDRAEPCEVPQEELLKNAPMKDDGFIKVKSVLE